MEGLRFLVFITMFKCVILKTIDSNELNPPLCPIFCRCDTVVRTVDCTRSNLSEIPEEIERNVSLFNLSFNQFNGIPKGIVNLPNLQYLDLSHNPNIRLIEINFQSSSLKNLQLRSCSINYIDNSVFRGFPELEVLNLSENPIHFLNNTLVSLSLKSLDFSRCSLRHIKAQSLLGVTHLSHLSFSDNHNLRQFHIESNSVWVLDISNCNLDHVPPRPLKKVVELDLHGNNIQWLRNKSFENVSNIENLNMSYNAIKSIEINSFFHLNYLTILDLSYNRLTAIEKNTFENNERLKSLYMSHNYLRKIKGIASKTLKLLDLSSCEINHLTQYSLTNLPALTELHLVRNQISHIPDNMDAPHLVYLDIGYNDITSINNETFASMGYLRFLILSGNKLTTVDPQFFPQVVDLSIEDNPWLCDCEALQQIYHWMARTDQNIKRLRCQLPAKLEGLSWEEACYSAWSKSNPPRRSVWWYSLSFFIVIAFLLILVNVLKKIDDHRKTQVEQEVEERNAVERLENIQRQQTRERLRRLEEQEQSRNAPDPRESSGPPTYNEALMLPKLDASHPSLAGSLPSLSSLRGSNTDISKRRRARRKKRRRRKSLSPQRDVASSSNQTDGSDNERHRNDSELNAVELEESSF